MRTSSLLTAMLLGLGLVLGGCCRSQLVFQTQSVSMTKANGPGELKEGKPVTATWCTEDAPIVGGDEDDIGMMDQVIMKAQKQSGSDFLLNAKFFQKCSCMTVKAHAVAGSVPGKNATGAKGKAKKAL